MAVSYVGTGTPVNSSNATLTPPLPTGLAEGDLLVCLWSIRANTSGVNTPAGWTAPVYYRNTASTTGPSIAVLTRTYTAGVTAPALSLTTAVSSATVIAAITAYRGADPAITAGAVYSSGTGTTQNIGPITGVAAPAGGAVIVTGAKADDWTSVATLAGDSLTWVECFDVPSTAGNDGGMVTDTALTPTGLTTSAQTFTVTGGTAVTAVGVQLAIGPGAQSVAVTGVVPDTGAAGVAGVFLAASVVAAGAVAGSAVTVSAGAVTAVTVAAPPTGPFFRYDADHPAANYATLTTTGGLVDQSGNARTNAFPASTAARPTLNTGGAGGHSFATFDGVASRLSNADAGIFAMGNNKPGLTLAAIVKPAAGAVGATQLHLMHYTAGGTTSGRITISVATGMWQMQGRRTDAESGTNLTTTTAVDTNLHLAVAVKDFANGTQTFYLDGQSIGTNALLSAGNTSATNALAWSWGSSPTPSQWFPGDFYEIFGYDRALTATEVTQLWSYGQGAYGLTASAAPVSVNVTAAVPGSSAAAIPGAVSATAIATVTATGATATANTAAPAGAATAAQVAPVTGAPAAGATAATPGTVAATAVGFVAATGAPAAANTTAPAGTALAGQAAPLTGVAPDTTTTATAGAPAAVANPTIMAATPGTTTTATAGSVTAAAITATPAAAALISEAEFHNAGANPAVCTPITAAVGDYLVAVAHFRTGATANTTTATDSAGNTWTQRATNVLSGVNSRIVILTAPVTTALTAGTVTIQTSAAYAWTVNITRWSGVTAAGASNSTNQAATTTPAAVTVATTTAGDAVVGCISIGSATPPTLNAASGFTALTGFTPNTGYYGANAYRIPGAAGTYGPSWTIPSAGSASAAIALTAGGAPPPPAPTGILANGSFEADTNADGLADNWDDEHFVPTKPTYTLVASPVTDGTKAQRMQYTGEATLNGTQKTEIYQATPVGSVKEGQTITFTVWVSGTLTNCYAFIGVEAFNAAGTYINEHDFTITPTSTPQKFTVTHPSLPAGSSYLAVYLQVAELYPTSVMDLVLDAAAVDVAENVATPATVPGAAAASGATAVAGQVTATAGTALTGTPATSVTTAPAGAVTSVRNARNSGVTATTTTAAPAGTAATIGGATAAAVTGAPAPALTSSPAGTVVARRTATLTGATPATATTAPAGTVTGRQAATITGVLAPTTTTALTGQATTAAVAALLGMAAGTGTDTPPAVVWVTTTPPRDLDLEVTGPRGSPATIHGPTGRTIATHGPYRGPLTITGPWRTNAPTP